MRNNYDFLLKVTLRVSYGLVPTPDVGPAKVLALVPNSPQVQSYRTLRIRRLFNLVGNKKVPSTRGQQRVCV